MSVALRRAEGSGEVMTSERGGRGGGYGVAGGEEGETEKKKIRERILFKSLKASQFFKTKTGEKEKK